VAKRRGWLTSPITWREGRAPFGFVLIGAFLFYRTTVVNEPADIGFVSWIDKGFPPSGWPVFFIAAVFVIVWVQWVGAVQAACNELALGGEAHDAPTETVPLPATSQARVPAPAGGGGT
jgi:hypothetical protein